MAYAKKQILSLLIITLFIGCGGGRDTFSGATSNPHIDSPKAKLGELEKSDEEEVTITDGDTIKLFLDGEKTTIRLIGIDTFESRQNNKSYRQAYEHNITPQEVVFRGKLAKTYLKAKLAKQKDFYLEYDEGLKDRYQRILGYVWLSSKEMLNLSIVCDGYAMPLTIKPNTKYQSYFQKCY
jgi:micrococcal nuclease